jgi:hypothetical protein
MNEHLKFDSRHACEESFPGKSEKEAEITNTTLIQKLATASETIGERFVAMCRENYDHTVSTEGFAVVGEQDGLYRALALTRAKTPADWYVKYGVLRGRCCITDPEGMAGSAELTDEIPAMLAGSLLDDAAALLRVTT